MNQPNKSAQESGAEKTQSPEMTSAASAASVALEKRQAALEKHQTALEVRQASLRAAAAASAASAAATVRTGGDIVISRDQKNGPLAVPTSETLTSPVPGSIAPSVAQAATMINAYQRKRRRSMFWSLFLCIGMPVVLSIIYYGWIATDQYICSVEYVVKTPGGSNAQVGANGVSLMKQALGQTLPNSGGLEQAIIAAQYIQSVQIIDDMKPEIDVRKLFSDPKINWLSRLAPNATEDELLLYWRSMVKLHQDATQGYAELTVRAFTPEDAKAITDRILKLSELMVNHLSDRGRKDAETLAKRTSDAAEQRLKKAETALQDFLNTNDQISPDQAARNQQNRQADLEKDISNLRTSVASLRRQGLSEEAPTVKQATEKLAELENQLRVEKSGSTLGPGVFAFPAPTAESSSKGPDANLHSELEGCRSRLAVLRESGLPDDAPAVIQLTRRIAFLESTPAQEIPPISGAPADAQASAPLKKSPGVLALEYQALADEITFSRQIFLSAFTQSGSMELDELRHITYLQAFLPPRLPKTSEYPKRIRSVTFTLLVCGAIWGLGSLFVSVAREHI